MENPSKIEHTLRIRHKSYLNPNEVEFVYIKDVNQKPDIFRSSNVDDKEQRLVDVLTEIGPGLSIIQEIRVPDSFDTEKLANSFKNVVFVRTIKEAGH